MESIAPQGKRLLSPRNSRPRCLKHNPVQTRPSSTRGKPRTILATPLHKKTASEILRLPRIKKAPLYVKISSEMIDCLWIVEFLLTATKIVLTGRVGKREGKRHRLLFRTTNTGSSSKRFDFRLTSQFIVYNTALVVNSGVHLQPRCKEGAGWCGTRELNLTHETKILDVNRDT